jgi:hypothetical protein
MPYSSGVTQRGGQQQNLDRITFMKTNTIHALITIAGSALIAGLAGVEVTGDLVTGATVGLSYLVVATLVAIIVSDYRVGPKAYFASPVVTNHFKPTKPAARALRTPGAKARLAA